MIINLTFFIFLFFFCGKAIVKLFSSLNFSFLENLVFGMFFVYIIVMFFTILEFEYKITFIFLFTISIFSLIFFIIKNFYLYKLRFNQIFHLNDKLKNLVKLLSFSFVFSVTLIIYLENILDILIHPLQAGDGLAYWFRKAKFFIHNPGIEHFPQKNYPNFVSSLWSVSLYLNYENFNFSRIILPFILFVNVILVYWKFILRYKNFLINSLLLFFVLIFYSTTTFGGHYRYSNSGYVDFALSIFCMTGFIYIFLSFVDNIFYKKDYFFGCVCLGFLSSMKNEGLILSFGLLLVLNLIFLLNSYQLFKKNIRIIVISIVVFVVISILPLLLYKYFQLFTGFDHEVFVAKSFFSISNLINLQILKDRFPLITVSFLGVLIENRLIIFALILLIISNMFFSKTFFKTSNILLQILILISLFCIFYIYTIYLTTNMEINWHLNTSLNRIFFPFTGIICSLCFLFCNFSKETKKTL